MTPVRVGLDAMGGDYAPRETVRGAVAAAGGELEVVLFGHEDRLREELSALPPNPAISVVHTSQEVEMHESPVEAFRKKRDSSLRRAIEAVASRQVQAMVSAGNTGAAMAGALLTLGAIEGVHRPAIATALPTVRSKSLLIDAGANVDCNVDDLYQFAVMGYVYVQRAWKVSSPTIGILNIGEEPSKGNLLAKQTHDRLLHSRLNFIGNVEAREFFLGKADVVVCDGFVGNVLLKAGEGAAEMIASALLELGAEMESDLIPQVLYKLRGKMDYSVYGGAPLLGLNGICLISHGRSRAAAIASALQMAAESAASGLVLEIHEQIKEPHSP